MPNSFKITGIQYYSKTGTNTGTMTANDPRNIMTGFGGGCVIGTGVYSAPSAIVQNVSVIAEGYVKFLGDGVTSQQVLGTYANCFYTGIYFENFAGIKLSYASQAASSYNGCTFNMLTLNPAANILGEAYFNNCVFINFGHNSAATNNNNFGNCLFINSVITGNSFTGCYLDATSGITANTTVTNCNLDPANPSATTPTTNRGIRITTGIFGDGTQAGCSLCIKQAPQFSNVTKGDYSIKYTSPHVALGIGPAQLSRATSFYFNSSAGSGDATITNSGLLSSNSGTTTPLQSITGDGFVVNTDGAAVMKAIAASSTFSSTYRSGVMVLDPDQPIEIGVINFIGGLNINTDFLATSSDLPVVQNNNVPDANNGTTGAADRNPNRLTINIRWSVLAAPDPTNPAHWFSGATFLEMELFVKASYNASPMLGNGSATFVPANALPVLARSVQFDMVLRNNYGV